MKRLSLTAWIFIGMAAGIALGIAGTGSIRQMGRIGLKAIVYFELVTRIALPAAALKPGDIVEHVFPTSIVDAMARGDVLQVVVFSFLFGAACAAISAKAKPVVDFAGSLAEVVFRYTGYVMYLAPLGVGAATAVTVGSKGFQCCSD